MTFISNLKLTGKIVMLVSLLGALSVTITLYSMINLYAVDRDYRALLEKDAQASMLVGAALLDLSDASRLVFAVLTEQEEAKMRATQQLLNQQQDEFRAKMATIRPLLSEPAQQMNEIVQQEQRLFELAATIIDAAARWRGDRALNIIHQQFDPTLQALRQNMDDLRDDITSHFLQSSIQLNATTRATLLNTAVAFGLALTTLIGLSAWLSLVQISRPINQLTQAMSRLSLRDYAYPIEHTERRDEVGRMAQALQVFRDNMQRADRLELEAAASAEARRLSQQLVDLTDAMPGAVFQLMIDPDGRQRFIFLSGKARRFIGHQNLGTTASGLLLDEVRVASTGRDDDALRQAISHSRQTLAPLDIDMQVAHGERRFWLKTLATARRTHDGGTLFNGVWLDISEIKAQAQALEIAKEQAEQAAKAKSAFLATMSHEIRTPMNAIIGLTQMSLRLPLEYSQQERLERILRAGQHLLGIINDILDFSKIDGGHLQAERIPFAPQQLLDDAREMLEERAEEKGLTLQIESARHLPVLIGDPLRISQILLNYTHNALKFSDDGVVRLRFELQREEADSLYLYGEVEDQGIGLTEAQTRNLFQPFQQADSSITRRFGGTGLGLAISRNLAQLLGGDVGVRSQPNRGSTFWFRVRVDEASGDIEPVAQLAAVAHTSPQALRGLRLLLVDDNELNRLVASELLREVGIRVDQAYDGWHALTLLEQAHDNTYDAVLMDMMMPELDGLSVTRLLRQNERFSQLPIIAMTANASREDVEHCLAAGMNAHVAKPIDEQRLWKALIQHCLATPHGEPDMPPEPPSRTLRQARSLDPRPLEHLRQLVSAERFARMLDMLTEDCRQRGQQFNAIASTGASDPALLRQQVHDLISTTGQAGLEHLSELGRALHAVLQEADSTEVQRLAQAIHAATEQAILDLHRHFGLPA